MRVRALLTANVLALVGFPIIQPFATLAQRTSAPPTSGRDNPSIPMEKQSVTLLVSVRESNGMPLDLGAIVRLDANAGSVHTTGSTQDAGTASFPNIPPGDYNVQVSAPGYQTTTERIEVMGLGSNYIVYVYVRPESAAGTATTSGSPTVMAPRLQAEIDKALEKMRKGQYEAAREHLEKGVKMAPSNADLPYLLGALEYKQDHFEAAQRQFQAAISLNPNHEKSRVALGELQLRLGNAQEAAETLEKAYAQNGADWKTHFLLAQAYAAQKSYEQAEPHAARAAELTKSYRAPAQLLLGRILVEQGKREEASRTFEALLHEFPNEAPARDAKIELEALQSRAPAPAAEKASVAGHAAENVELSALPLVRAWAPPDIDAKEYPVAPDVTCSLDQVIHRAELRSAKQLGNFERFMATEHIVHQEVDADGYQGSARTRDFAYLVFVQRMKDGSLYLEEQRDGGQNLNEFPSHLASTGLVSLGVALFERDFQKDLNYQCEGLGKWREQAAWQIRFEQRKEVASRLRTWRNTRGTFPVPLKGRVWVSATSYDVVHLETDVREPQPNIGLQRDHLIVDYGPVQFEHAGISLWLPWYAELFMEVHGKRYHHRHTLTNYALFSVDTNSTVTGPKGDGVN